MAISALIGGVMLDIAVRAGLATVAAAAWVAVVVAALLLSGRVRGSAARASVIAAAALALLFAFRSSPWVLVPVTVAVTAALLLGVSLGADRGSAASTFPALAARLFLVAGHLICAPGLLRSHHGAAGDATPPPGPPPLLPARFRCRTERPWLPARR